MTTFSAGINAGCRAIDVADAVQGTSIPVRLLYPTRAQARPTPFGPFRVDIALDAPVDGHALPLVVISHGSGGTPFTHRDLALHLARAGCVAALVQHPGNCRADDSLSGTVANLENRPRHLHVVIDAALTDPIVGAHVAPRGVTIIGHSMGGYTALAVAGGKPTSLAQESPNGAAVTVPVRRDARVSALVLLAPATPWFMARGALADVDVPILMRTGERDMLTTAFHAQVVASGLQDPAQLDHLVVANAGHFAFLSPYPPEMVSPAIPPSQDPPGFDRAAYLPVLFDEIVRFIRRAR